MRRAALFSVLLAGALSPALAAATDCGNGATCLDAEPLWLTPSARYWSSISDTGSLDLGELAGALSVGFRMKPAVLEAPAPNAAGREINLILHTTDLTAGLRLGVGSRMELTLSLPAGLYQRGAGIKAVTHQSAPPIAGQSLHDPRVGFGYALPLRPWGITGKARVELKLPLGDREALMGEQSFVMSPTLALSARQGPWFSGGEIGLRLRRPSQFFARRIGTQAFAAVGIGYELSRPQLAFTLEAYVLRNYVARTDDEYDLAAEWLAATHFTPSRTLSLSFGLSGGTNIPAPSPAGEWRAGVGAPLFRLLAFARWSPAER